MAERNQLKIVDHHGIADDDPFAELTKIMGFDPREPARPQSVEPELSVSPEGGAHDDFDIDLEKELMGDFSFEDEAESVAASAEAPSTEQVATPALEDEAVVSADTGEVTFEDDMEDAVASSLDDEDFALPADVAAPEQTAAEPFQWDDEPAYEQPADAGSEEAQHHASAVDGADPEMTAALEGTWFEPVLEDEEQTASAADVASEEAQHHASTVDDADPEMTAALQGTWFEPVLEDEEQTASPAETVAFVENGEEEAAAGEGVVGDGAFDAAASADMDGGFTAADAAYEYEAEEEPVDHAEAASYTSYEETDSHEETGSYEPAAHESASYQAPVEGDTETQAAPAVDAGDLEAYFDDAATDVDMNFEAPREAETARYDAPEAPVFATDDEAATGAAPHDDIALDEDFAPSDIDESAPTLTEAAVEAPVAFAETPAPSSSGDTSLEDELNALLAKMTARPAVTEQAAWPLATPVAGREQYVSAPSPQAAVESHPVEDDLHAMLEADLDAMNFDEAPHVEDDFDAEAFHAALHEPDEPQVEEPVSGSHEEPVRFSPAVAASAAAFASAVSAKAGHGAPRADAPEVETIDVPERAVALADDLDIPDVPFEEPATDKLFDDLENEFTGLLGQMNDAPAPTHAAYRDDAYGAGFSRGATQSQVASGDAFRQAVEPTAQTPFHPAAAGFAANEIASGAAAQENNPFAVDDLAYDPDDAVAQSGVADEEHVRQPRRGLLIAGIVCAVAVAGGLGALALSFGGGGANDAPALVKADNQPIKVKPENPGGTVIPNQNNKVYDAMAKGIQPAAPAQQKLVTTNEDPVDVNAAAPQSRVVDLSEPEGNAPVAKSEDRIEPTAQDNTQAASDIPVVTPHKVRTMIVKPDGSLVPREDPAPQIAASEPADPAPQHVLGANDRTGTVLSTDAGESALKPANTSGEVTTPKTAPIAPQRPSDQPVDVVGEVKPDQVASIDATASTAPAGEWSMQIASQPTADSAQSTYNDLSRRYASVLNGRGVNIVKADIAGKGTFYRVRVPTQSRNDAIKLCESYKAAGGNCFVSK